MACGLILVVNSSTEFIMQLWPTKKLESIKQLIEKIYGFQFNNSGAVSLQNP